MDTKTHATAPVAPATVKPATVAPAATTAPVVAPAAVVKQTKPKTTKPTKPAKLDQSKIRRGLKKAEAVAIVEKFKFPTTPFTLNQIFAATGIYHWYLVDFVKKNGKIVGDAPKAPGVRGKAAKLYQISAAK
jgi:hypothetical protein